VGSRPARSAKELLHTLRARNPLSNAFGFEGVYPSLDIPCDPRAPHGYFGIEGRVVEAIARYIRTITP